MSQGNQFHQYGYDHYLKAPKRPEQPSSSYRGLMDRGRGARFFRKLQSPAVATIALVASGILFTGVIIATYPSGENRQPEIPIVKADLRPIKEAPQDAGGMDIPNRESTILARVGQSKAPPANALEEPQAIENLLAQSRPNEDLVSKEQALERAMKARNPMVSGQGEQEGSEARENAGDDSFAPQTAAKSPDGAERIEIKPIQSGAPESTSSAQTMDTAQAETSGNMASAFDVKEPQAPQANDILQKIGDRQDEEAQKQDTAAHSDEFAREVASAAQLRKPARPKMHAAAQSPETIDYVRSVLNHEPGRTTTPQKSASDETANSVEPAAGLATASRSANTIESGTYFVQLASITDAARAGSEWAKMQEKYNVLSASKFRVQEANLSKGTFYRIQAGPMSKSSAERICDELKRMKKPGGCLVVK